MIQSRKIGVLIQQEGGVKVIDGASTSAHDQTSTFHTAILSSHESTIIHHRKIDMGVFRFADKYAAPTKEQRERYMIGMIEEKHFGPEGQIVLIEYHDAMYLKDDIDNIRILFTGFKDKQKAREEVKRLVDLHEHKAPPKKVGEDSKSPDR